MEAAADGFVFEGAFRVAGEGWTAGGEWYRGVRAREEAARGLNDREDVWAAGSFRVELRPGDAHEVTAAAAPFANELPTAGRSSPPRGRDPPSCCDGRPRRMRSTPGWCWPRISS